MSLPDRPQLDKYHTTWRDRLACALCNFILRFIATERYRRFVAGSVLYGMHSAARDHVENREIPEHWSHYIDRDGSS